MQDSFTSNKPYLFRAIYEWLLDNNGTPYILVDASLPNVDVPLEHIQNGQIVLNASPGAIRDWLADNHAISFSARFSGKSRQIYVPMNAILAIYAQENGLGMAFPKVEEESEDSELVSEEGNTQLVESVEIDEETLSKEDESISNDNTLNGKSAGFSPEVVESESLQQKPSGERNRNSSHLKVVK